MSEEVRYDPLTALRLRAQDAANSRDDEALVALAGELRGADDWWPTLWAVHCALAAGRLGRIEEGLAFLEEAVAGGFCQAGEYEPELSGLFGSTPGWRETLDRIAANVPPPPVEIVAWPRTTVPPLPVELGRLATPDREELLRGRIPEPSASAWDTARRILEWTTTRWRHGNNDTGSTDAVELLDAAGRGERFRCVEYTHVLTQSLNAAGIPARNVGLRQRDHHVGVGRGHVVSEAWIDDLGTWVLLDGQNGLYWHDGDRPLGLPELLERGRRGEEASGRTAHSPQWKESEAGAWWSYFATATAGGIALVDGPFSPVFQSQGILRGHAMTTDPAESHPDLSRVRVGYGPLGDRAALTFRSAHPFADGYVVTRDGADTEVEAVDGVGTYALPAEVPGEHVLRIRVRTAYGPVLGGDEVVYRVG